MMPVLAGLKLHIERFHNLETTPLKKVPIPPPPPPLAGPERLEEQQQSQPQKQQQPDTANKTKSPVRKEGAFWFIIFIFFYRDARDIRPDNSEFFLIRYSAGYRI
jgi:hypothetical protein